MKNKVTLLWTILAMLFHISCSESEDERTVEFWTDKDISEIMYNRIYVDGSFLGVFTENSSKASCGGSGNVTFNFPTNTSIDISLHNNNSDSLFFGNISLGDFNSGLSINSSNNVIGAVLVVDGTSNDPCTTIYMYWD